VNFPSYVNRFSTIMNCLDCYYKPIKKVFEKITKKKNPESDLIFDINKDNSSNNLISKQRINSVLMNLSKEYSEVFWDIEKEKQIIIKEVEEILNLKMIDIYQLINFTKHLDSIVLGFTKNEKQFISEASLTHKTLNILLKDVFNSLDFFLSVCKQLFTLSMMLFY
jgi:hypothetical protein